MSVPGLTSNTTATNVSSVLHNNVGLNSSVSLAPNVTNSGPVSVPLHTSAPISTPPINKISPITPISNNTPSPLTAGAQPLVTASHQRAFADGMSGMTSLPTATVPPIPQSGPNMQNSQFRNSAPSVMSSLQKSKKGVKRKADTTTPLDSTISGYSQQISEAKPGKMSTRRESGRPIKKPSKDLPDTAQHVSKPKKGKMSEQMKYCSAILKELFAKKHAAYAWPFYKPVDVESLHLHDYYDIIKHPMDLGTVKVMVTHWILWLSLYWISLSSFRSKWKVESIANQKTSRQTFD